MNIHTKETKFLRTKIAAGYVLILLLTGGIVYTWMKEWRDLEAFEKENRQINLFRGEVHEVYVQVMELSLLGETVLEWDEEDVEAYRRQRLAADSLLSLFRDSYPESRIDSVRHLLENKERQLCSIMEVLNRQEDINEKIARKVPVIAQKSAQEEQKKPRRKGFLGLFGKKEEVPPTATTSMLHTLNRDMIARQKEQSRQLAEYADSLSARNVQLNHQLQTLIEQIDRKVQDDLTRREQEITAMRERSFLVIGSMTGFISFLLLLLYAFIHSSIKQKERTRRKLEESIRQNNLLLEMRKKIILTISHDIRGPLNIINGSTELAMGTRDKKKRDHHLQNVRILCKHILHLLNNLLDVYRLNESKESVNAVPFRLSDFLNRIASGAVHMINDKGLLFTPDFQGTDVTVKGDMDRMEQIIDNLLTNAVKFTSSGTIGFAAEYADGTLRMDISDTGVGIPEEALEHLFQPFQRHIDSSNADGFGLGLSITKGLVSLLGGTIDVASAVGKGTTFRVSLPLPLTDEAAEKESLPADIPQVLPRHVLVIDDDPMQLGVVKEMLERNGVSCTACTTVVELIRRMRRQHYDLLLTDIQMPGTNGFALLELLRKSAIRNSKEIPVIAMTARGDNEKEALLAHGFTGCIFKPFSTGELLKCLSVHFTSASPSALAVDFTPLTSETADKRAVMERLIESLERDREELRQAAAKGDRRQLRETVHRMWPVWELLQRDGSLQRYREVLKEKDADRQTVSAYTEKMVAEITELIACAGRELEHISHENEEENTDSGR